MPYMEEYLDMPVRQLLEIIQNRLLRESVYFGVRAVKSPVDFWIYQEIIFEMKPDFIVEIGNASGGGALAMAHMCDALGKGRIIGLDITHEMVPEIVRNHPRISLMTGDACALFGEVDKLIGADDNVLVIEDSEHTFDNTLNVLRTYWPLVKPGGYFIVEDGICHHGLEVGPNPGPFEAIEAFLKENERFAVVRSREAFFITWNPKGYLKRIA